MIHLADPKPWALTCLWRGISCSNVYLTYNFPMRDGCVGYDWFCWIVWLCVAYYIGHAHATANPKHGWAHPKACQYFSQCMIDGLEMIGCVGQSGVVFELVGHGHISADPKHGWAHTTKCYPSSGDKESYFNCSGFIVNRILSLFISWNQFVHTQDILIQTFLYPSI